MTLWAVLAFVGGLLIPDPWTLLRIWRYRRLSWDALIGVDRFNRDVMVYVKRKSRPPADLKLKAGKFYVVKKAC